MKVLLRERSFGELIGLCFSVAAGHFGVLFLLCFLLNLPGTLLNSINSELSKEPGPLLLLMVFLGLLVVILTAPLLQATTIRIVASSFTGEPSPLGDCLRMALRKMWPLLGLGMVTGLIMSVGMLFCLAPGFIFLTWYYLGPPALVIEDLGVGQAMGRSKSMSSGRRWEILGFALVTILLFQGLSLAIASGLAVVIDPRLAPWVSLPFNSLLSMPLSVAPVIYYFNLRVAREGFDLERLSTLIQGIGKGTAEASAR